MGASHVIDIWGETAADDGATAAEVIFFPGAGRDPLSEELIAARGHLLAVAGGAGGRAAARAFIAALVPAYYAAGGGAEGLRRAVADAEAAVADPATLDFVAAAIAGDSLYLARAGGGRAYRVREAGVDPLARATAPTAVTGPAFSLAVPLRAGDRVVLCSAAPAAAIGDGRPLAYVAEQRAPREAAARLIALARERGATGDVSIVVAFVRGAPALGRGRLAVLLALGVAALTAVGWLAWELFRFWQVG